MTNKLEKQPVGDELTLEFIQSLCSLSLTSARLARYTFHMALEVADQAGIDTTEITDRMRR
jgi:hypothetical protein